MAQALLIGGIHQHGQQQTVLVVLGLAGQFAYQRRITGHAHLLQTGQLAETALQQGGHARTGHHGHVLVRGSGDLAQGDLVMTGYALQFHALHDVHQRDDRTGSPGTARTAGTVDVAFVVFRGLVEKNMGQGRDVDAARGHVRGHQILQAALADLVQHGLAAGLGKVGRQLVGIVAEALQHAGDIMDVGLGVAKDDGRCRVLGLQQAHQHAVLVHGTALAEQMLHFGHMHFLLREGEHGRLGQEFPGQLEHVRRIGGREHAGVDAAARQVALHFLHVGVEADGQHAVGFVEDQGVQIVQRKGAAQQMVQHAAGRAHHQLGPVTQGVHLLFVAHAAIDGHGTDARAFEQGARLVLHLHGQLAGGHQDQGLGGVQFGIQTRHQGQQVAAGLAAAGTGLHHDVAAFQQVRQGQGLHGHQGRPARTAAGGGDGLGQGLQRGARQGVLGLGHGKILKGSAGGGKFGRRGGLFLRGLSGGGGAGRIGDVGHDGSLTHGGRGDPVCRRCGWVILLMSETH